MTKYYEVGYHKAALEKTSSGYWIVTVKSEQDKEGNRFMFSTEAAALHEILSYAEMDEDFWKDEE